MSGETNGTPLRGALLALRFGLELCALGALLYWGFHTHSGAAAWLAGLGAPLAAAVVWGALVAPKRALDAPIGVRLTAEAAVLAAAAAGLVDAGARGFAVALVVVWIADWAVLRISQR